MSKRSSMGSLGLAALLLFAAPACTSLLGGIDFEGGSGGGTTGTGGSGGSTTTTTGTVGSGGSTTSTTGTGGTGGATCDDAGCDPNAICDDASGEAICTCKKGFHGDGKQCADWDECKGENGGNTCKGDTSCVNTPGGYACACPPGDYEYPAGSGTCVNDPCDPDPCNALGGTCDHDTGVAVCACSPGWFGPSCADCVRFVDGGASGAKNGFTWADAFTSVQPAIETAEAAVMGGAPSCDVWVKKGTYYIYESGPTDTVKLYSNVHLYGGFAGGEAAQSDASPETNATILSGKKSAGGNVAAYHVVTIAGATGVIVDGFTIQDGKASGMDDESVGGGIQVGRFNAPASCAISRCEIKGSSAAYAAGISFLNPGGYTLDVSACAVHDNSATQDGGGMGCGDGCSVKGTVFRANTAKNGGGALLGGAPTLSDCSFTDNVTSGDAGGIWALNVGAGAKLVNLVFDGNRTNGVGGGIYTSGGAVTITNGLFLGNVASSGGAVADDSPGGVTLINCTLSGNLGTVEGDGIRWYNSNAAGAPKLSNSIVWGNPSLAALVGDDIYPEDWASIGASHSDVGGYAGVDASSFDASPLFAAMPAFFDRSVAAAADVSSVVVASGAGYAMGDVLEIGKDGVARTVNNVAGGTVSFAPPLAAAAAKGTQIRNWDLAIGTLNARLAAGSPCINVGTPVNAPAKDLEGNGRVGLPDLGVYEHP
jgi:hypothetical protein